MLFSRLKTFLNPFDGRYEDLARGNVAFNVLRDFTAGLVVAAIAIPLAMGFAMASGLRPEQGIVGGAVAGLVGALFGGSKYQVYGPTAAFIPIIGAIMQAHDHGFLVAASIAAGIMLWLLGLFGAGRIVRLVPHSIIVGFTIGIAITIAASQGPDLIGVHVKTGYSAGEKLHAVMEHFGELNLWAVVLCAGTVLLTKLLLRISPYIPAPLVALGIAVALGQTWLAHEDLDLVVSKYGSIPPQALILTPPSLPEWSMAVFGQLAYYAVAIVFVAAIESLLCSRMADRLANNHGQPYNPDKELAGQGMVMTLVPLLNGFPHTGALARTATNIKLGAISPLAGAFKFALKLTLAFYLAHYLELVPMASIAGILVYVSLNMVKKEEVHEVIASGKGHMALMAYTALAVVGTDFLRGVVSALIIYTVWKFIESSRARVVETEAEIPTLATTLRASIADARRRPAMLTKGKRPAWSALDYSFVRHQHPPQGQNGETPHATPAQHKWLSHISAPTQMASSAYVHHQANIIGRVILGRSVHIAAGASVRADEGTPFHIGDDTNIQDGVVIHALQDRHVLVEGTPWAVYIGERVSLAHDALVHGPCYIGDDTFVGFKAVVHDSVVRAGCYVSVGAIVVGVELAPDRLVPAGAIIDSQAKADALKAVGEQHREFNADVVEVNRGLAAAYQARQAVVMRGGAGISDLKPARGGTLADNGWGIPDPMGSAF
jgi:MFS superfamily sulfate permease-like transporter/carbonic anhydrase/acetyltransferase-like protein (isoleucine patch superfamily)